MKKIPVGLPLPVLLLGISLLVIGYTIWLYGIYSRKKLNTEKEIEE